MMDSYNIFDTVLVAISSVDTVILLMLYIGKNESSLQNSGELHQLLAALRAFRLLRIFKLANSWNKFNDLLQTVWKTMKDIWIFSIFLLLFCFLFALLGMELFAYSCKVTSSDTIDMVNGSYPNKNFNTFYQSFLTVFVLLTMDSWSGTMLDYYRAANPVLALIFFLSFMIIGQYLIFNLFLAILLQNFDEDSVESDIQ